MKKLLAILLTLALVFAIAACNGAPAPTPTANPSPTATATPDATPGDSGEPASGAALKIVIVTSGSTVDDGSFNQDNYNGILSFIANNPASTVTPIQSADIADSMNDVESVVADYDVIVMPGFQFAAVCL